MIDARVRHGHVRGPLPTALCLLLVGCNVFRPKPEAPDAKVTHGGPVDTSKLTADRIVAYLNNQADLVASLEAKDISLTAKAQGNTPPTLDGSLMVQKPRDFRLVGRFLGSTLFFQESAPPSRTTDLLWSVNST